MDQRSQCSDDRLITPRNVTANPTRSSRRVSRRTAAIAIPATARIGATHEIALGIASPA